MPAYDNRIEDYIEQSQPFARPILTYLRQLVHLACPDLEETIKWSFPHFEYRKVILCSFASFKQHCAFNIWFAPLLHDPHKVLAHDGERTSMGHFGAIGSLADLPADDIIIGFLQESMGLIERGIKVPRKVKAEPSQTVEVPEEFLELISQNQQALAHFNGFSPSQQREYTTWITEAKTDTTRQKRMSTAIEWLAEGKKRNWKYEKC